MAHDATSPTRFGTSAALALEAAFDGGKLTTDGGLPWLARVDSELGLCESLAASCVPEWRRGSVTHSLEDMVRQRVLQIACGYEDQDDADLLRADPLFKLACGRLRSPAGDGGGPRQPAHPLQAGERPRLSGLLPDGPGARRALREAAWRTRRPRAGAAGLRRNRRSGPRWAGGRGLPRLLRPAPVPSGDLARRGEERRASRWG